MIEALHKYDSLLKAAANRFSIAFAAALALALAIGVNAAIFNIGELRQTADSFPDPTEFFLRSHSLSQADDAALSSDAERPREHGGVEAGDENALPCALFHAEGGNPASESRAYALLLGDYLITQNLDRERERAAHAPGSSACE